MNPKSFFLDDKPLSVRDSSLFIMYCEILQNILHMNVPVFVFRPLKILVLTLIEWFTRVYVKCAK